MSESESEKSRASDLDGAGPSTPPPRTHVLRGEAAERDHVQQGGRLPRGYPMPQGIEGPPPPELAVSGSNAVRGRPASYVQAFNSIRTDKKSTIQKLQSVTT